MRFRLWDSRRWSGGWGRIGRRSKSAAADTRFLSRPNEPMANHEQSWSRTSAAPPRMERRAAESSTLKSSRWRPVSEHVRPGPGQFNVWVSEAQRGRALALIATLIECCRSRGWTVEPSEQPTGFQVPTTVIHACDRLFGFQIREAVSAGRCSGELRLLLKRADRSHVRMWRRALESDVVAVVEHIERLSGEARMQVALRSIGREAAKKTPLESLMGSIDRPPSPWRVVIYAEHAGGLEALRMSALAKGWTVDREYGMADWDELIEDVGQRRCDIWASFDGLFWIAPMSGIASVQRLLPRRTEPKPPRSIISDGDEGIWQCAERLIGSKGVPHDNYMITRALVRQGRTVGNFRSSRSKVIHAMRKYPMFKKGLWDVDGEGLWGWTLVRLGQKWWSPMSPHTVDLQPRPASARLYPRRT